MADRVILRVPLPRLIGSAGRMQQVPTIFILLFLRDEQQQKPIDHPEQLSSLPHKKKKNQESSAEEKERNKSHSRKRIVIEHTICRMKKYRIMGDIFRNRLRKYNRVSDIVSGLVNYRILASSY